MNTVTLGWPLAVLVVALTAAAALYQAGRPWHGRGTWWSRRLAPSPSWPR